MTFSSMRIVQLCDVRAAFSERVILSSYRTIFIEKNIVFGIGDAIYKFINNSDMKEIARLRSFKNTQQSSGKQNSEPKSFKSITSRFMEKPWGFTIPNKKKQQLDNLRKIEIQLQDKSLTSRKTHIKQKRNNSMYMEPEHRYLKKPLHEQVRKQHYRIIREENKNQMRRIQQLRSSIDHKQFQKQWNAHQNIRNIASKNSKGLSKQSISHSIQTTSGEYVQDTLPTHSPSQQIGKFEKQREINGHKIDISIEQYSHVVMIVGRLKVQKLSVVMVVERKKLQKILLQKCKGKLENFPSLLEYDAEINSLYYLTSDPLTQDEFISDTCSQLDLTTLKKALQKQHQILAQKRYQMLHETNENLVKDHTCTTNAEK